MWSKVWLRDPDGQMRERSVRVTPEAVQQWLGERDVLRRLGRPDRPPDIDLPTMREWVPHPGEEGLPYFTDRAQRDWYRLYMVWWADDERYFDVRGWDDGRTLLLGYIGDRVAFEYLLPPMTGDTDTAGDLMVSILAALDRPWLPAPSVTEHDEFRLLEQETLLAAADVERGFHDPLPEGRA